MNIYVANLHPHIDEEHLRNTFAPYGEIESAKIIVDLENGISKGYGFINMPNEEHARNAIENLAGSALMGQAITVREANPPGGKKKSPFNPGAGGQRRFNNGNMPAPVVHEGKIKFFNNDKGYGFIVHDDNDIFFQRTSLSNPGIIPQPEQVVEFKTKKGPKGVSAVDVVLK